MGKRNKNGLITEMTFKQTRLPKPFSIITRGECQVLELMWKEKLWFYEKLNIPCKRQLLADDEEAYNEAKRLGVLGKRKYFFSVIQFCDNKNNPIENLSSKFFIHGKDND